MRTLEDKASRPEAYPRQHCLEKMLSSRLPILSHLRAEAKTSRLKPLPQFVLLRGLFP